MCWVIPPNSESTTLVVRMASSSLVLPWSTWPITVTIGGRGRRSSALSVSVAMIVSSYRETILTLQLYSAASRVAVSASICWLMVTIMPMLISLEMSSEALRFILRASSETVITSMMAISRGTGLIFWLSFFFWLRTFSWCSSKRFLE